MCRVLALTTLMVGCLAFAGSSSATTLKDVKVEVRVLDFVGGPVEGSPYLGIVYDPQNRESLADAQTIESWFGNGDVKARNAWVPVLADVHRLGELPGFRAAILADGMGGFADVVLDYARRYATLTISSDLACVRAGKCAVGVSSLPRVEVILSRQASQLAGVSFPESFRMMVTEY